MLTKKSDKILNAATVIRILNYPEVRAKYKKLTTTYCDIKPGTGTYINYVFVNIKRPHKDKINDIVNEVKTLFEADVKLYDSTGNIRKSSINVIQEAPIRDFYNSVLKISGTAEVGKVNILFPLLKNTLKSKLSEVNRPGAANEFMMVSIIKDQLQLLKEIKEELGFIFPTEYLSQKLDINLYEKISPSKKGTIKQVKSIERVGEERVGGLQQKPDVKITTAGGIVNISIKQDIFPSWSSAWTYSGALSVMDYLVNNNLIQITNTGITVGNIQYEGIAISSTVGEVKKFCFNNTEIDYAIVNSFSTGDIISQITKSSENTYSIDLKSNIIYGNNDVDITRLRPTVFLAIRNSTSSSASALKAKYPGFVVNFIPENKISENNLYKLKLTTIIPGRL
jgi:hypothetical protein